jgi:ubiquinone/menaquinone biosynthesis C-methylase UbiE
MTLYQKWCIKKAEIKRKRLLKFYQKSDRMLEIGSGNCALTKLLREEGLDIQPLDIKNKSAFPDICPIIYDGQQLPFEDKSFELVQMITMLHHTPKPEEIIKEAQRVGKKLIIMEDLYTNNIQKQLTFFADSLNNWEFIGHPHTNKDDQGWKNCFEELGLEVVEEEHYPFLGIFRQATYVLI